MAGILYIIGLVLVIMYLFMGLDDLVWDIVTLARRTRHKGRILNLQELDSIPPKLIALAIAAWKEENVIGDVINNIIASTHYPKSMYHIFLGVYPNDDATLAVANALAARHKNLHVVVNSEAGPTSKAQNINYVIKKIYEFEKAHNWEFAGLTIHDSEDVVHPFELKVTNYLLDTHDALQFPVFPLMQMPTFRNFFKNITTGTYADEFAENHFTTMVNRRNARAFVPSAGTGFTLSRKTLLSFNGEDVLPKDSLTEDYRLSLTLYAKGIHMHYVLERIPRVTDDGEIVNEFIATRSLFPNTFKTATKQKARWILGITMQSFKFKEIFAKSEMKFVGRYSMYKDIKAKIGNLLAVIGYPVLIYFIVTLFMPLTPIYPFFTVSWYLNLIITAIMIERQIFRAVSIYHVYGMRSVFFACLLPPILPIRLVWGNVINFVATLKAYKQRALGNSTPEKQEAHKEKLAQKAQKPVKKLSWDKTEHEFLSAEVLRRFHRYLGDVLLEKAYITPALLQKVLKKKKEESLGRYLLKNRIITEAQLLDALADIKRIQYLTVHDTTAYEPWHFSADFDEKLLREIVALPIIKTPTGYAMAFCEDSALDAQSILKNKYGISVDAFLASKTLIKAGLDEMYEKKPGVHKNYLAKELYEKGIINCEQLVIVNNYAAAKGISGNTVLKQMGLIPRINA